MAFLDQPQNTRSGARSPLRSLLPYTTALLIVAALYVAWVLYSRYDRNRRAEAEMEAKKAQAEKDIYDTVSAHGELSFTTFEAATGVLRPGETTQLCYGVVNAASVKIDPPVEQIKPSYRHCMDISPRKTTTYTITASDSAGHTKSVSLTVQVKGRPGA